MMRSLFPRFRCRDCPYLLQVGPTLAPTYYCDGFPGKRKPKRFPRSGLTYPKPWCPKLISPPICRIYDFIDDRNRFMDCFTREAWEAQPKKCISPERRRYEAKAVVELGLTAKQFFEDMQDYCLRMAVKALWMQAITLLGKKVIEQGCVEKYLTK